MAHSRSLTLVLFYLCFMAPGCQARHRVGENLGIGAIAVRNLGHTRQIAEVAPGAGDGVGYLIADELDLAHASALSDATVGSNYSHDELGPLTNTRWRVRSLKPEGAGGSNLGMVVTFRPSGHVVTRTIMHDGTTRLVTERYRVVGDTLIINNDNYVINAHYRIQGETLTIGAGAFVGVFDRIRSRDGL